MKKNVLIWAGWYPEHHNDYSGIFIKKHIELISSFVNIRIFSIKHKNNLLWFKKKNVQESYGKVSYYFIPSFFPLKLIGYFLIPFIEAIHAKKKFKHIDVFHLHISYPFVIFTLLLDCIKIKKWILTEHWSGYTSFDNSYNRLSKIYQYIIQKRLSRFHKISVVSEFLKTELVKQFPHLQKKLLITNNVIESSNYVSHPKNDLTFKFLTISNLIDNPKNISFLLSVFASIIKEHHNIQLDIYGEGKDKHKLIEKAKELNLLNIHIFFKGKINNHDIHQVYSNYHAFILLSKFETFSIVTAEALANGLPVIITKCGGPEEFVIDGKNGYIVEINDMQATKNAIIKLIKNYHSFDITKIQESIRIKYSTEKIIQQFINLYD